MPREKKAITIFGGTGFVGRHVINQLAKTGATICVPTRNPASGYFLKPMGTVGQIVPVLCDIHNDHDLKKVISGSDCVINLIGVLHEKGKRNTFKNLHHLFPKRLAEISHKHKVSQFIHVSAIGVDEHSICAYLKTKALGEKAVFKAFKTAIILRPSLVFGPEDNFFNLFAKLGRLSPVLPLIGGGKTKFQPVYVGDIAKAVESCLINFPQVKGQIFELGGASCYSFKELLMFILKETKQKAWLVPVPWFLAKIQGTILSRLPGKLLTRDQVEALKKDNIVALEAKTLHDLSIRPTAMETIVPRYLESYRKGGQFADQEGQVNAD